MVDGPGHQTDERREEGKPPSDEALVARAKQGDLSAFEELVSRYERQVYGLAWRILRNPHDAEDITQQTFMKAVEHIRGFREESRFSTWLLRIATYAALKVIRKRKGLEMVSLDASRSDDDERPVTRPEFIADWKDSPERLAQGRETGAFIEKALDELDEKYRLIFLLRDVEGVSVRETAETLGITEANVKVRLLRARLQLRERLTRYFGDPRTKVKAPQGHEHG